MGTTIKIKIVSARNLPVMDSLHNLTDAYVEIKFGPNSEYYHKTSVCRKSLNPTWNQQFRIEVPDFSYFQENVLELKIWDYDIVSTDDIIGYVYIDPSVLVGPVSTLEGWLPIFDSLRGIGGEIYVVVKIEFFENTNPFKDAARILFYSIGNQQVISQESNKSVVCIKSMVDELLVDDDPEHDWKDTFRSSRTSNEQRVLLLFQLSGRVRRQIGKKALQAGGNVVIGYYEHFDLEENSDNIIVRGLGTACLCSQVSSSPVQKKLDFDTPLILDKKSPSPSFLSLYNTEGSSIQTENLDKFTPDTEVKLITLKLFDVGVVKHLGGVVSSRSIKLIKDMKRSELAMQRDRWWNELREEIRRHARTLRCTAIIGYSETTIFHKDLCILSAVGTAAVLNDDVKQIKKQKKGCEICHIPYNIKKSPFTMDISKCAMCNSKYVPEVLLSTTEIPTEFICGRSALLEARVLRPKSRRYGEANANAVSDLLPFIEYDLNKQLLYKMKVYGFNAAFNLQYSIVPGDTNIVATVTATGCYAAALPTPTALEFHRSLEVVDAEDRAMFALQNKIQKLSQYYNNLYQKQLEKFQKEKQDSADEKSPQASPVKHFFSKSINTAFDFKSRYKGEGSMLSKSLPKDDIKGLSKESVKLSSSLSSDSDSSDERSRTDDSEERRDAYVVEIDDDTDEDNMAVLLDPLPPEGLEFSNLCNLTAQNGNPLSNLQSIVLQRRYALKAPPDKYNQYLCALYHDMYSSLAFRFRTYTPCLIAGVRNYFKLTRDNEIEITLQAMTVITESSSNDEKLKLTGVPELIPKTIPTPKRIKQEDLIFEFEDEQLSEKSDKTESSGKSLKSEQEELSEDLLWIKKMQVILTPIWCVPGATIKTIIGRISQHIIRERVDVANYATFVHNTILEVNAIISAHASALGANAVVNYHVQFHVTNDNPARKHAYVLITAYGDAVILHYKNFKEAMKGNLLLSSTFEGINK